MEKDYRIEILNAIKENKLYDYIANNYWKIEKEIIVDLLKECIWLLGEEKNIELADNLKDVCEWED